MKRVISPARYVELEKILQERKLQATRYLSTITSRMNSSTNEVIDDSEASVVANLRRADGTLIDMAYTTIDHINSALIRLNNGEYGYCVACKGEIDPKRIDANPFAIRCFKCESDYEEVSEREKSLEVSRRNQSLLYARVAIGASH